MRFAFIEGISLLFLRGLRIIGEGCVDILEIQDNHRNMENAISSTTRSPLIRRGCIALLSVVVFSSCDRDHNLDAIDTAEKDGRDPAAVYDWPLFRGDAQMQGVSREVIAPPLLAAWKFEPVVEKGKRRPPIEASPVIGAGRVFVGGQDSRFYAIDLESGAELWSFKAEGPIIAPAAVLGQLVFFGDTYGFVYALDTEKGTEKWRFETEGKVEGGVNTLTKEGQPNRIFVGSHDYYLYCLDAHSGEMLWKHETGNYVVSTPSLIQLEGSEAIAFGGCDGLLHVIPCDGKGEKREIEIGSYIANTSAVSDGICYVAHNGGEVVAVDIASGETVWKTKTGVEYTASPAVDSKWLYVAGPDKRLVAYDRGTGSEVWAFLSPRALASSPLLSGEVIWQGGMDGRLYAINAQDGTELWNYELGAQIKASPAASRGTLVVCGEDGVVYGFRK